MQAWGSPGTCEVLSSPLKGIRSGGAGDLFLMPFPRKHPAGEGSEEVGAEAVSEGEGNEARGEGG